MSWLGRVTQRKHSKSTLTHLLITPGMSTFFNDVFEKLLEDGFVDVAITGAAAETLRTSLVRRWNSYKRTYDSLGFLTDDKKDCSLSMTTIPAEEREDGIAATRYSLKPRTRRASYQIL